MELDGERWRGGKGIERGREMEVKEKFVAGRYIEMVDVEGLERDGGP